MNQTFLEAAPLLFLTLGTQVLWTKACPRVGSFHEVLGTLGAKAVGKMGRLGPVVKRITFPFQVSFPGGKWINASGKLSTKCGKQVELYSRVPQVLKWKTPNFISGEILKRQLGCKLNSFCLTLLVHLYLSIYLSVVRSWYNDTEVVFFFFLLQMSI